MKTKHFIFIAVICLSTNLAQATTSKSGIKWVGWSEDIFRTAQKENKLVILDLEAIWCHWCHVMDAKTYSDPKVAEIMKAHYIAIKVDQDSRPDLSNRYEEYGWPATIIFSPTGQELVKHSGYIASEQMISLLEAVVKDPTPGPSITPTKAVAVAENALLTKDQRAQLSQDYVEQYDTKYGGWDFGHKFLQADSVEWALSENARGNEDLGKKANDTLKLAAKLIDPAWGGIYQYSAEGWDEPHFEKIMSYQGDALRIYSLAYAQTKNQEYLKNAQAVRTFLKNFLTSPEGAFYTSQNADLVDGEHSGEYFKLGDKERRAKGTPRVDKNSYGRENGWAISGMVALSIATGDSAPLKEAIKAAEWIQKNRALPNGGFRHDTKDGKRLYLGDSLYMASAFLQIYAATADRKWLKSAENTGDFVRNHFTFKDAAGKTGGFITGENPSAKLFAPLPQRDENVAAARFFNLLHHYTGSKTAKEASDQAMRYLASPNPLAVSPASSILIADYETTHAPLHLTIVGSKKDTNATALFVKAAAYPSSYKRIEWLDRNEGALPNPDVTYPTLDKAAAFICSNNRCSRPIYNPDEVLAQIRKIAGLPGRS